VATLHSLILARSWRRAVGAAFGLTLLAAPGEAQTVDSVYVQAQRLVSGGNGAAGRALVDSVLTATPPGTMAYAEALYWKATLAETAAVAERAYLTVAVEYPLSPRASAALLRLSQLEFARGERALGRHLARLTREHPGSTPEGRAGLWGVRMLFDEGDAFTACALMTMTRAGVPTGEVELLNQIEYLAPRCMNVTAADTSRGGQPVVAADTAAAKPPASGTARPPAPSGPAFSVQIAAYRTKAEATTLATRLTRRGYQARVTAEAPYRVRIGRYATRPEAIAALQKMRQSNLTGIVVEAEKR
jgi:hypothetical protein